MYKELNSADLFVYSLVMVRINITKAVEGFTIRMLLW